MAYPHSMLEGLIWFMLFVGTYLAFLIMLAWLLAGAARVIEFIAYLRSSPEEKARVRAATLMQEMADRLSPR